MFDRSGHRRGMIALGVEQQHPLDPER